MSNSLNVVVLSGNLGADAQVKESKSGVTYARLSIAINQQWQDGAEKRKRTDWIRVVAFNGLSKTLTRLVSGDEVAVQGRLQSKTYKVDGDKRTVVEVVATSVKFLRLKGRPAPADAAGDPEGDHLLDDGYEDDIPF